MLSLIYQTETNMKHYTFKQVGNCVYHYTSRKEINFIAPPTCGKGEFVTIGNRNTLKAVFIKSLMLPADTDFRALFDLPAFDIDTQMGIIQYNTNLGGYLYTWAAY